MGKIWQKIVRLAWRLRVRRLAFVLTIAVFCLLVVNIWLNYKSTRDSVDRDLRIVHAGGQIALLDEVLTMSARMSALTGDPMWEWRYNDSERELDALLRETLLIVPTQLADTVRQTQAANQLLVDAEREALALSSQGELERARVLVWSPEYEQNKLIYSRALRDSINMLQDQARRNVNASRLLALVSTFAASIGIMMSFMLFLAGFERYQREQKLRHELALYLRRGTVERLALGLTHELGQPLSAIGHYADAALETIDGADDAGGLPEMLRGIKLQSSRAAAIVQRTRDFATSGTQQKRVEINLNGLLKDVELLTRAQANREGIEIEFERSSPQVLVKGERVPLQQVFVNLVLNAIESCTQTPYPNRIRVSVEKLERSVKVRVLDTGAGIHPEVAERIFDAFYSSKPDGLGLGLPISRDIVEAHGGSIEVEPVEKGACLAVELPRIHS